MNASMVAVIALAYLSVLFAIAWAADRSADRGRSLIANPLTYALSVAVYHTSWTFYGSVGRAASTGVGFLPIYLGPTLMSCLAAVLLVKMVRIAKANRITSIADFVSARYGKSALVGGLVTVIAVVGVMPYISLQLKAVATTFTVLLTWPDVEAASPLPGPLGDTALLVALILAAFAILFGTRHIDASERHEGMVAAIAFESVAKLIAFLVVGGFVTFGLFNGVADIFGQGADHADIRRLYTLPGPAAMGDWVALCVLSMMVILCLPRQFQVSVIENVDERHIARAVWLFPLYMFLINLFVLPIAVAGRLSFGDLINPDLYVLALPLAHGAQAIAVIAFLGGLSAAASMVIVETIALSTMVCNDLVMPVLLRIRWLGLAARSDLSGLLLGIRRGTIVAVVLLGYAYVRLTGDSYALASIGLVSFCAAAQFAPALIGGVLWKGATAKGALAGLSAGFLVWLYTLLLPSFARSGWISHVFVDSGIFGIELLKPYALFGLGGLEPVTHSLVWSVLANLSAYIGVSLLTRHSAIERIQAVLFVDDFRAAGRNPARFWRGTAQVHDLLALAARFVGRERALQAFDEWGQARGVPWRSLRQADSELVGMAERLLAGAIGTASARVMVASVTTGEEVGLDEVMEILDEASQIIAYSQKLEAATTELREANERLKELDRLKDDFMSTVTHELRTPLTSIRSFSEILFDNPALDEDQRQNFLSIIIKESERLTRLINQVLDLAKIESGRSAWSFTETDPAGIVADAVAATHGLFEEKGVTLQAELASLPPLLTDRDKLMQVVINLLSNAVKFAPPEGGRVRVELAPDQGGLRVTVSDNGPGIPAWARDKVFDKFQQVGDTLTAKPQGTGLGLTISRNIVEKLGGRIWVEGEEGQGAVFVFFIPTGGDLPRGCETVPNGA